MYPSPFPLAFFSLGEDLLGGARVVTSPVTPQALSHA